MNWSGVLFYIDEPSIKPPGGARGHKLIWNRNAAENIANTIVGGWVSEAHMNRKEFKVFGEITKAEIVKNALMLYGVAEARPKRVDIAASEELFGMSVEARVCHVHDIRSSIWLIDRVDRALGAYVGANCSMRSSFQWED